MELLFVFLLCVVFALIALRDLKSGVITLRGGQRIDRRTNPGGFWLVGGFMLFVPVVVFSGFAFVFLKGLISHPGLVAEKIHEASSASGIEQGG